MTCKGTKKRYEKFSDSSHTSWGKKRFEPRCPESKEGLLALTHLQLPADWECNLSGNQRKCASTLILCLVCALGFFLETSALNASTVFSRLLIRCCLEKLQVFFFLTGAIPSSLGNCVNLTTLVLSNNRLTGCMTHHTVLPRKVTSSVFDRGDPSFTG
jgi:hypothetical protein